MNSIDEELREEFERVLDENNINTLGDYKRWAKKEENEADAEKFSNTDLVKETFESLFESSGRRGRGNNFLTYEEFRAFLKEKGLTSTKAYGEYREKLTKKEQTRLPYYPNDFYAKRKK